MTSTEMVLHGAPDAFAFADRIASSGLVPMAYRNKPVDLAIAVMYGNELGLPPMTALQRVVVINGKPTLDAQGFVSLIRQAGHSISGEVDANAAVVVGKRYDTGDTMKVTFTMEDAKQADLLKNATYRKFPTDMLWARAVTQLARRLFPDVMLAVSYAPEEMQAVVESGGNSGNGNGHHAAPAAPPAPVVEHSRTLRPPPGTPKADEHGEIIDAEVVEQATPEQVETFKAAAKASGITTAASVRTFINETLGRNTVGWGDLTSADIERLTAALGTGGGRMMRFRVATVLTAAAIAYWITQDSKSALYAFLVVLAITVLALGIAMVFGGVSRETPTRTYTDAELDQAEWDAYIEALDRVTGEAG